MSIEKTLLGDAEKMGKPCVGELDRAEGGRGGAFLRKMAGELRLPATRRLLVVLG